MRILVLNMLFHFGLRNVAHIRIDNDCNIFRRADNDNDAISKVNHRAAVFRGNIGTIIADIAISIANFFFGIVGVSGKNRSFAQIKTLRQLNIFKPYRQSRLPVAGDFAGLFRQIHFPTF